MTEVGFYHLMRGGPEVALPALLVRTLAVGKRAVVVCPDAGRVAALDRVLWEGSAWLPHGTAADGDAGLQPIWLDVVDEAPNGAQFLFVVDGVVAPRLGSFERVFDLFDGNDEAQVVAARERWKGAKAAGHALTYWQQGAQGWEKKA